MSKKFFKDLLGDIFRILQSRLDNSELNSLETLTEFIHSRSAYVAQTSLYGYLKTRMGRQYVDIFQDKKYSASLNRAKWLIYFACLSDLVIYATSKITLRRELTEWDPKDFAVSCYEKCIHDITNEECPYSIKVEAINTLKTRAEKSNWANLSVGSSAFTLSPETLANNSPVIEKFQELDREIVLNSVRFRWNNIRDEFTKRANVEQLFSQWQKTRSF